MPCKLKQCLVCGQSVYKLTKHIKDHNLTPKEYYHKYVIKSDEIPKCEACGKELEFHTLTEPYYKTCDINCRYRTEAIRSRFIGIVTENNKTDKHKEYNKRTINYALAASDKKLYKGTERAVVYIIRFENLNRLKLGYSIDIGNRLYRLNKVGLIIKDVTEFELNVYKAIDLELHLKLKFYDNKMALNDTEFYDSQVGPSEFYDETIFDAAKLEAENWIKQNS